MDAFEKYFKDRYPHFLPYFLEEEPRLFKREVEKAFNAGFKHGMDYGRTEWTERVYD